MSDDYVTIQATIKAVSPDAVLLEQGGGDVAAWVPRSCLFGPSETRLDKKLIGQEVEIGVREWMAKKKGFIW